MIRTRFPAFLVLIAASLANAQVLPPDFEVEHPSFHRRLVDPTNVPPNPSQAGTEFGYSMLMGKVGTAGDLLDDLVSCSIGYNWRDPATGIVYNDMGRAYPYVDAPLSPHPTWNQVLAGPPAQADLQLGVYYPALGRVDSTFAENMIFLGAGRRNVAYPASGSCPAVQVAGIGSVEIFRLTKTSGSAYESTLVPPRDTLDPCAITAVGRFGYANSIGEIDGSTGAELAVGAQTSEGQRGRVYVFFGGANFAANAANLATNPQAVPWIALKSPAPPTDHEWFGASVLIRDLDGDGKGELIVGAIERNVGAGVV